MKLIAVLVFVTTMAIMLSHAWAARKERLVIRHVESHDCFTDTSRCTQFTTEEGQQGILALLSRVTGGVKFEYEKPIMDGIAHIVKIVDAHKKSKIEMCDAILQKAGEVIITCQYDVPYLEGEL